MSIIADPCQNRVKNRQHNATYADERCTHTVVRTRLLDLFCGAGGAAVGYHRAGFEVTGVDLHPQPRYPFKFIQADAMTFDLAGYDVVHASPPCQAYSCTKAMHPEAQHPRLLGDVQARLVAWGGVWVIENVAGARRDMASILTLCGTMFDLPIYRHRIFASNMILLHTPCAHPTKLLPGYLCIYGHQARGSQRGRTGNHYKSASHREACAAMGIDWMTQAELSQAIPPAYTEYIGHQLMAALS